jgi:hypothetical protein
MFAHPLQLSEGLLPLVVASARAIATILRCALGMLSDRIAVSQQIAKGLAAENECSSRRDLSGQATVGYPSAGGLAI